jgi:hypothetical protein
MIPETWQIDDQVTPTDPHRQAGCSTEDGVKMPIGSHPES